MTELLTAAQMRAIEQAAIASGEVTGLELMERAGRGVVAAIFEEWPDLRATSHRAVVLCGPGNNGGDGFVVARLLKEWGWEVEVFLYGDPDKLPPDARVNYERWGAMGEVSAISAEDTKDKIRHDYDLMEASDVVVDALFGTGLTRAAPLLWAPNSLCHEIFNDDFWCTGEYSRPRFVAVDIVSGVCADSGKVLGASDEKQHWGGIAAHLTVSFHSRKAGHVLGEAPRLCTKIRIADIGLGGGNVSALSLSRDRGQIRVVSSPSMDWHRRSGLLKDNAYYKYAHGHALILSGGPGKGGAARLAARGALRIGAGLVTLGCPAEALAENAARLDAIMLRAVSGGGVVDGLKVALEDERINALCVGPGLGLDAAGEVVTVGLKSGRSCVLDADALTWLAEDKPNRFKLLHDKVILTPHGGEFARLFPDISEKLSAPATKGPAYSKVDAAREAAKRTGCVVLYKGPDTVIADPSGRCSINSAHYDRAAPWLGTAGSGDVLAGFITGLLARGFDPMQAAETGAWLHVECARSFGPGLIAEDLPEQLPLVYKDLGL